VLYAPSHGKKKKKLICKLSLFSKEAGLVCQFPYSKGFIIRGAVTTNEFMFQHNPIRTSAN